MTTLAMTTSETILWTGPAVLIFWGLPGLAIWLHRIGRRVPVYLEFVAAFNAVTSAQGAFDGWHRGQWVRVVIDGVASVLWVYVWWITGGGDRWRRLQRRLAERVAVVGSRLAVVPAPA